MAVPPTALRSSFLNALFNDERRYYSPITTLLGRQLVALDKLDASLSERAVAQHVEAATAFCGPTLSRKDLVASVEWDRVDEHMRIRVSFPTRSIRGSPSVHVCDNASRATSLEPKNTTITDRRQVTVEYFCSLPFSADALLTIQLQPVNVIVSCDSKKNWGYELRPAAIDMVKHLSGLQLLPPLWSRKSVLDLILSRCRMGISRYEPTDPQLLLFMQRSLRRTDDFFTAEQIMEFIDTVILHVPSTVTQHSLKLECGLSTIPFSVSCYGPPQSKCSSLRLWEPALNEGSRNIQQELASMLRCQSRRNVESQLRRAMACDAMDPPSNTHLTSALFNIWASHT